MTINSMANSQLNTSMIRIATGKRINSAADDAAGLGIVEKMTAQIRGLEQGTRNTLDMQSLVNTAEGGLSGITENLQRMRELTLQASNGILTDGDRQHIQNEIDQIRQEIDATTDRTEFNGQKLLDGGFSAEDNRGLHTASDANGRGPTVSIGNMSSDMLLGPEPFNVVTGEFDLARIDNALSQVTGQRAYLGAMHNRFDVTIANNQIANLNLSAARSGIRDADIALEVMNKNQASILEQAQMMAERRKQEEETNRGVTVQSLIG